VSMTSRNQVVIRYAELQSSARSNRTCRAPSFNTTRKNSLGEFVLLGRYHTINVGLLV
jgi:hypothetical protein